MMPYAALYTNIRIHGIILCCGPVKGSNPGSPKNPKQVLSMYCLGPEVGNTHKQDKVYACAYIYICIV